MSKIRINELARQLEIPSHVIVEMLPEVGVTEKKTHSSSIDEPVAELVRKRVHGEGITYSEASGAATAVAEPEQVEEQSQVVAAPEQEPPVIAPKSAPVVLVAETPVAAPSENGSAPAAVEEPVRGKPAAPVRPPLASSGPSAPLHPPLRTGTITARPVPAAPRPGQILSGPRQPLPPATPAASVAATPARPSPHQSPLHPAPSHQAPAHPAPSHQAQSHQAQSHQAQSQPAQSHQSPLHPSSARASAPPAVETSGPAPSMPLRTPQRSNLAGQPAARPIVPPRPDMVARLQQTRPAPGQVQPQAPRPGMPTRSSTPVPGQPIYRGPIRPGQPVMRGPGMPGAGGGGSAAPGFRRTRTLHPTSPLRMEPAAPLPTTEQQRRHAAKPGSRDRHRDQEQEEGRLRMPTRREQPAAPPPIDREITISEGITLKELSEKLGIKANLLIKKLVEKKIFATINQNLDVKMAEDLARDFGASTNKVSFEEESTQEIELAEETADRVRRAPVVTIMGHVDHGKTSLLDAIRSADVAAHEAGGITQHIGAYHIEKNGRKIVFIDTPGHEAFTRMRARGAKVTDIVVLVVAADDGVMPQTIEAIDHAKAAKVPIIVAINKIDRPDANIDRIKQQLADRNLLAEDWGGDVVMVPVSARAKTNLDLLLEMILLVADLQDLKANPDRPAVGTVLEAQLDRGRGPVATVLVRNGTLRVGDYFICGSVFGKVRAMFDDRGQPLREAEPSMPAEVLGLDSLPEVGDTFQVVTDTGKAKQIVIYREAKARDVAMSKTGRVTLEQLHEQLKEGEIKELNIILKTDVGGTAEVISDMMQKLSNDKIKIHVLRAGVGAINESDVLLASASNAIVIGFSVRPERNATALAEQEKVDIRLHTIIYELTDELKRAMTGMLEPVFKEVYQGRAQVRDVFRISKVGNVAGCMVTDGLIRRDSEVRVLRDNVVVFTGKMESLKRFKNDASEVKQGFECGLTVRNFSDIKPGDVVEAFATEKVAAEAV